MVTTYPRTLFAIDPGVSGGIAYRDTNGLCFAFPMPESERDIADQLRILAGDAPEFATAFVEDLPRFAGRMSASAMFAMAKNFGVILGVLSTLKVRLELMPPQKWQKIIGGLGTRKEAGTEWKRKLKATAQKLFPHLDVTLKTADALLILEAGIRSKL